MDLVVFLSCTHACEFQILRIDNLGIHSFTQNVTRYVRCASRHRICDIVSRLSLLEIGYGPCKCLDMRAKLSEVFATLVVLTTGFCQMDVGKHSPAFRKAALALVCIRRLCQLGRGPTAFALNLGD